MKSATQTAIDVLDAAIRSRKSIGAFKPDPVPTQLLREIVEIARAAPSNFNSQPWRVYVRAGKAKDALGEAIERRLEHLQRQHVDPFEDAPGG